jgi:hypothetical protein
VGSSVLMSLGNLHVISQVMANLRRREMQVTYLEDHHIVKPP